MSTTGKRIRRTRLGRTHKFVIVLEVDAVIPDYPGADPSEPCYEPETVEFLREVEARAESGSRDDIEWLKRHGKVYAALDAA